MARAKNCYVIVSRDGQRSVAGWLPVADLDTVRVQRLDVVGGSHPALCCGEFKLDLARHDQEIIQAA
jgi:hypothetical protein